MVGLGWRASETAALAGVLSLSLSTGVLAQEESDVPEVDMATMCLGEGLDWQLEPRLPGLVMESFGWLVARCPGVETHEWATVDCERRLFLQMTVYRDGGEGTLAHRKPIDVENQMTALRSKLFAEGKVVDIVEIENAMRAAGARVELSEWSGVAYYCADQESDGN